MGAWLLVFIMECVQRSTDSCLHLHLMLRLPSVETDLKLCFEYLLLQVRGGL